jgi:hypothetical protein
MKRNLSALLLALTLGTTQVRAEFLQIDLSIFGMD